MKMITFTCSLAGEIGVEEEGYNGCDDMEVKNRHNPNFNVGFSQFGLKIGHYRFSYKIFTGSTSSYRMSIGSPVLLQKVG